MDNNLNETEINVSQNSIVQVDITNDSSVDVGVSAERSVIRGVDGFSPIAKVTQETDGARITITDINGTTTAIAKNGERGEQGIQGERGERGERGEQGIQGERGERGEQGIQGVAGADGFSPIATVNKSGGTATITITDKDGTTTASVTEPTIDSTLSWTSQNPVENQTIRNTIYTKNSSGDKEAGINIAFSNPNVSPYVHLGSKTSATRGNNSVGIGNNAEASAVRSVAIGNAATASKREGVALGPNATAGQYSLSIGYYTNTVPNYSTAVGPYAKVLTGATNATAIGYQSEADEAETVSVGKSTNKRRIVNVADGTTATDAATVGQIPTKTSDLTNDGADNTSTYVEADELATVATSGSYNDLSDKPTIMTGLVEMSYGESNAWAKFIAAYQAKQIVYCRASGGTNPGSGSQTRKAFMAYVNNADSPTSVEFQYVRSVSSKTASQPVDQVFVYTLTNVNGGTWTAASRNMGPKLAQGTNTNVSYSNGTYTISSTQPTVPTKTSELTNDSGFITSAPKLVDLSGQIQTEAFHRSVIALCRVSATANTELNSWSSGRIVLHRNNGLGGVADVHVNIENQYSGAYYTNISYLANVGVIASNADINTATGFRPCTFKYNNVYYGGIELYISVVNLQNAFFTGVGNFDVFGLDYYSTNTSSALNAEVFNSINFTQFSKTTNTWLS